MECSCKPGRSCPAESRAPWGWSLARRLLLWACFLRSRSAHHLSPSSTRTPDAVCPREPPGKKPKDFQGRLSPRGCASHLERNEDVSRPESCRSRTASCRAERTDRLKREPDTSES